MIGQEITEVLTISQAAKRYAGTGLTGSAIRRLATTGTIPCRRIGVKYLIPVKELEDRLQGESQPQALRRV